ncbi:MAG: DUF1592 domain-containing protein [Deltaproteobacteria bacterium]|nr:DUF1592 domain-containing protein [Deltaproteobacteria bacterium]
MSRPRRAPLLLCAALAVGGCLDPRRLEAPLPPGAAGAGGAEAGALAGAAGGAAGPISLEDLPPPPAVPPGPTALRRLTRAQYTRALHDVLSPDVVVPALVEPDVNLGGLLAVGASDTTFSPRGVASIEEAAGRVAAQALAVPSARARAVPCDLAAGDAAAGEACARDALALTGRRAWRRPLAPAELDALAALYREAAGALGDRDEGLALALSALLQSPYFLFRVELGGAAGGALDPYALASRLSFFLWDSTPDDALLDAAAAGALGTAEGLRAAAERLLASPRARVGLANYLSEQLRLYELDGLPKDALTYEHFSPQLLLDAREETLRGLLARALDDDADLRDALTTPETFLTPRLAALYGVPAPAREGFARVTLPAWAGRAGLLGQASILSLFAHANSSSATLRGKFVRTVLLCQEIPPPPVGVNTAIPEPSGEARTLRERVREHLESPSCAGCHGLLDPIGLALERFDGVGRWRDRDNGALIDASGELDGVPFDDALGLGRAVRAHPAFGPCVARTLTRYAAGRAATEEEGPLVEDLAARFAALGYRLKPLLLEVVMSPLFLPAGAPR